jgi:GxxExxY protein
MNHEDHDGHEAHESNTSPEYRLRVPSPLSREAERVMTATIGCAIRVHRSLGPVFLESIYKKAMHLELAASGLSFEAERPVLVRYREADLAGQRVDLIVEKQIVVELKSVVRRGSLEEWFCRRKRFVAFVTVVCFVVTTVS